MGWCDEFVAEHRLPEGYAENAQPCVRRIAERILSVRGEARRSVIVGVSGAQGSGKTTFARFLSEWLSRRMQLAATCVSLDDVYLTRPERRELARCTHPLLETRGVPGTHDVPLAHRVLDGLTHSGAARKVAVPAFDKAADDRSPEQNWPTVDAPVDVVLFEGWCVGARPQPPGALSEPANALEAERDRSGQWRQFVNERLRSDYASLFLRLDLLVMLRVPNFEKVLEWRRLQEKKLRQRLRGRSRTGAKPPGISDGEIAQFVQHYERLTRHMLKTMPDYADAVIDVDENHRMAGFSWPERSP